MTLVFKFLFRTLFQKKIHSSTCILHLLPFSLATPNKPQSVNVEELESLYSSRFGESIPSDGLARLGFDSTLSLLHAIPHVVRVKGAGGGGGSGKTVILQQNLLERLVDVWIEICGYLFTLVCLFIKLSISKHSKRRRRVLTVHLSFPNSDLKFFFNLKTSGQCTIC